MVTICIADDMGKPGMVNMRAYAVVRCMKAVDSSFVHNAHLLRTIEKTCTCRGSNTDGARTFSKAQGNRNTGRKPGKSRAFAPLTNRLFVI